MLPAGGLAGGQSRNFEPALPVSPSPPLSAAPRSDTIDRACVAAAVSKAFQRAVDQWGAIALYGYSTGGQVSAILSSCASGPGVDQWRSHVGSSELMVTSPSLPAAKYVYEAIEKEKDKRMTEHAKAEAAKDRRKDEEYQRRHEAEKNEEDTLSAQYHACMGSHADLLALGSDEPAEVVAKAAMASCPKEQLAFEDTLTKHGYRLDLETRREFENITERQLLLRVMAARAANPRQEHPAPEAAPVQTPL